MTQQPNIYQKIRAAVDAIQQKAGITPENSNERSPRVGLVLGSGLGPIAEQVTDATVIPYSEIPYFHGTSVEGHAGEMILGKFDGVPVVCLKGRFHFYEGYPMEDVVFPTRVISALGIETLVLTNAAGGINTRFKPGDIMLIEDHINFMGDNPLKGPNLKELGPRFPDMTEAYSRACIELLRQTASELQIPLQQGVYIGLLGPTYETPAEVRMLRTLGADSVGMSTVPEAIAANHLGVRVAGISLITNLAAGLSQHKLTHEEVIENSRIGARKITALLKVAIPRLATAPGKTAETATEGATHG